MDMAGSGAQLTVYCHMDDLSILYRNKLVGIGYVVVLAGNTNYNKNVWLDMGNK